MIVKGRTKTRNYERTKGHTCPFLRYDNWASLSELGGQGLRLRPWLEEKSSKEVWWSERPRRSARASHIPPCQLLAESGFVKECTKQF
jgi:hypothetical protein